MNLFWLFFPYVIRDNTCRGREPRRQKERISIFSCLTAFEAVHKDSATAKCEKDLILASHVFQGRKRTIAMSPARSCSSRQAENLWEIRHTYFLAVAANACAALKSWISRWRNLGRRVCLVVFAEGCKLKIHSVRFFGLKKSIEESQEGRYIHL